MPVYNYTDYSEAKERKLERESMTVQEQKEMCAMFGGTWVEPYRYGDKEVAGYCRKKTNKKFR